MDLRAVAPFGLPLLVILGLAAGVAFLVRRAKKAPHPPAVWPLLLLTLPLLLALEQHVERYACKCGLFAHGSATLDQVIPLAVHAGLAMGFLVLIAFRLVTRKPALAASEPAPPES